MTDRAQQIIDAAARAGFRLVRGSQIKSVWSHTHKGDSFTKGETAMADGNYFKQRFIGGPLDGTEQTALSHEGINDGFWRIEHRVGDTVYTYKRQGKQFEDSDYLLVKTEVKPDPAEEYRLQEDRLREVVDYVADDLGCDGLTDGCLCITCKAKRLRKFGRIEYRHVPKNDAPYKPPTDRKLEGLVYTQGLWDCVTLVAKHGSEWGIDDETICFAKDAIKELQQFEIKAYGTK